MKFLTPFKFISWSVPRLYQSGFIAAILLAQGVAASIAFSNVRDSDTQAISRILLYDDLREILRIRSEQLSCDKDQFCPEGVAGLLIREQPTEPLRSIPISCHGMLISPTTMRVPTHCIPERIRHVGASCRNSIFALFVSSKGGIAQKERRNFAFCDEVIEIIESDGLLDSPESAVLRLVDPVVGIQPLTVGPIGSFPIDQPVKVVSYVNKYTTPEGLTAYNLETKTCRVSVNSLVGPAFKRSDNAVFHLSPCLIIPRDSGSAVMTEQGVLVGMIIGTLTRAKQIHTESILRSIGLLKAPISPRGYGTNLTCLANPGRSSCQPSQPIVEFSAELQEFVVSAFQTWKSQNPQLPPENWMLVRLTPPLPLNRVNRIRGEDNTAIFDRLFVAVPLCISRQLAETWARANQQIPLKSVYFYPEVDQNLELTSRIATIEHILQLELRNGQALFRRGGKAELIFRSDANSQNVILAPFSMPISLCSN